LQIDISLSCCKYPLADSIPVIWRENLQELMTLIQSLTTGIRMIVTNTENIPLRKAIVRIGEKSYHVSNNMAYFKIILIPGEYTLTISCEGYITQILKGISVQQQNITDLNVKMVKQKNLMQSNNHYKELSKLSFVNQALSDLNIKYPQQTTLHTIAKIAEGSMIMCLEIGSDNDQKQIGRPSIVFSAGILRTESVTTELLLHFATYLLDNYERNTTITYYIDNFSIYIAPDFSLDTKENLTCSPQLEGLQFPIHDKLNNKEIMIVNWFKEINAVLAINLNSGSRHIEIPFGHAYGKIRERKYESADEDLLQYLASVYAKARTDKLSANLKCERNLNISDNSIIHAGIGIGGKRGLPLIDYIYFNTSTLMMDVYITCCTTNSNLIWQENKASLLACLQEVNRSIKGYVVNEDDEPIENVILSYDSSPHLIKNGKPGFYSILLQPGTHNITIMASGYHKETKIISSDTRKLSRLLFKLIRDDSIMGISRLVFIMITGE
jgi:carboxypeptidase D